MSKQPLSPCGDDDLPPPYTAGQSDIGFFASHLRGTHSQGQTSELSDSQILATLIGPVDSFLASISSIRPTPKFVDGVVVPEDAVGPGWILTEAGDRHKREVAWVVRVRTNTKTAGDEKLGKEESWDNQASSSDRGFTDWGRYDDEVNSKPDDKAALWWSDEHLAHRLARRLQPNSSRFTLGTIAVRADEVTFRRENEMGIWESKTGWCIIVRVSLH